MPTLMMKSSSLTPSLEKYGVLLSQALETTLLLFAAISPFGFGGKQLNKLSLLMSRITGKRRQC